MTLDDKRDLFRSAVKRVLAEEEGVKFPMMGLHEVDRILLAEDWKEVTLEEELYCGWEGSFWFKWEHQLHGRICVSGTVWQSGDTYQLYKDDEEELYKETK